MAFILSEHLQSPQVLSGDISNVDAVGVRTSETSEKVESHVGNRNSFFISGKEGHPLDC